jgi:hypothetical protein
MQIRLVVVVFRSECEPGPARPAAQACRLGAARGARAFLVRFPPGPPGVLSHHRPRRALRAGIATQAWVALTGAHAARGAWQAAPDHQTPSAAAAAAGMRETSRSFSAPCVEKGDTRSFVLSAASAVLHGRPRPSRLRVLEPSAPPPTPCRAAGATCQRRHRPVCSVPRCHWPPGPQTGGQKSPPAQLLCTTRGPSSCSRRRAAARVPLGQQAAGGPRRPAAGPRHGRPMCQHSKYHIQGRRPCIAKHSAAGDDAFLHAGRSRPPAHPTRARSSRPLSCRAPAPAPSVRAAPAQRAARGKPCPAPAPRRRRSPAARLRAGAPPAARPAAASRRRRAG